MEDLRFAGCGATAVCDGAAVAEVHMNEDGRVEAYAESIEYAPLLHELLDGIESALVTLPPCGLDEELFDEFIKSVGDRCFAGDDDAAGFDAWTVRAGRGSRHKDETDVEVPQSGHEDLDFANTRELGAFGEELAIKYLKSRGLEVLDRNVRTSYGEADIVCRDRGDVVLVEVKTRMGSDAVPEESVDERKLRRYRNMLLDYLCHHDNAGTVRFDVVGVNVRPTHTAHIRHYQGIVGWEG